jgi:hypothetical protein
MYFFGLIGIGAVIYWAELAYKDYEKSKRKKAISKQGVVEMEKDSNNKFSYKK